MCFSINNDEIYTAKKNIVCYKYLTLPYRSINHVRSYHQDFRYTIGKVYKKRSFSNKIIFKGSLYSEGYHSFISKSKVQVNILNTKPHIREINCEMTVAVQCVIPRGARYLKNNNEYISSAIRIVGIMTREGLAKKVLNGKRKQKA